MADSKAPARGIVKQRSVSAAFGVSQSGGLVQYCIPDKLTSSVFGKDNPPKDWADISLLVPHETIRREEQAMLTSIDKLLELSKSKSVKSWQVLYFCEWYNTFFAPFIHEHHDIEERYYFPWVQTKVEIPEKQFAKGHEILVAQLDAIDDICKKVIKKQGIDCDDEIVELHTKMHVFVPDMNEHLMEEERDIPPLARQHFTEEEETKLVETFAQKEFKLSDLRIVWPAMMEAIDAWGTPEQRVKMESNVPGFINHLATKYWTPDYENCLKPKRDAPFLDSEPLLQRVGCFGISFCFPCIL